MPRSLAGEGTWVNGCMGAWVHRDMGATGHVWWCEPTHCGYGCVADTAHFDCGDVLEGAMGA